MMRVRGAPTEAAHPPGTLLLPTLPPRPDTSPFSGLADGVLGLADAKVGDERQILVLQTTIGDLRSYAVAQAIPNPAVLDEQATVPELLLKAFGQSEGESIFREGTACIAHVETELSTARPDLSNEG